jgi:hypothetical protein
VYGTSKRSAGTFPNITLLTTFYIDYSHHEAGTFISIHFYHLQHTAAFRKQGGKLLVLIQLIAFDGMAVMNKLPVQCDVRHKTLPSVGRDVNYLRSIGRCDRNVIHGGSNMTGTCAACLHTNQSRSYLNHLVYLHQLNSLRMYHITVTSLRLVST